MLERLFIEICPSCSGATPAGFCAACARDLPRVAAPCARCGLAQPVPICPRRQGDWCVGRVIAPFVYREPLDHYVRALKYRGARNLGRALGLLLAERLAAERGTVDALVPVPLHPARLRERGYNQAAEIARTLARALHIPLLLRGARRTRHGAPQSGQNAAERRASMVAAFAVERALHGARVAVVDDVITTGATVNSLAAALLSSGAAEVHAWSVARTP